MNEGSKNIKDILEAEAEYTFGDNLFAGREPGSPNKCVTLFDTPDRPPELYADPDDGYYTYNGVQARIRNPRYNKGMEEAWVIYKLLHNKGNFKLNGIKITLIEALDTPSLLDWDDNDRARIIINFVVQQTTTPST